MPIACIVMKGHHFEQRTRSVNILGTPCLEVVVVHLAIGRRKRGTTTQDPDAPGRCLVEDLLADLTDVAAGHLPATAGVFDEKR